MREIMTAGYPAVSTMLTLDPPLQTRYRKSVGKAFSTRRIESMEARIRQRVAELLETWPARGRVDFMRQMSVPLPVRVIADFLSIPLEREADVKRWSDDSVAAIGVEAHASVRSRRRAASSRCSTSSRRCSRSASERRGTTS